MCKDLGLPIRFLGSQGLHFVIGQQLVVFVCFLQRSPRGVLHHFTIDDCMTIVLIQTPTTIITRLQLEQ